LTTPVRRTVHRTAYILNTDNRTQQPEIVIPTSIYS
jgi:hypothetical protein